MGISLLSSSCENMRLRSVEAKDQAAIQNLVSNVLKEYGLPVDFTGADKDLLDPVQFYKEAGAYFFVLENSQEQIVGTAALYPINKKVVELRKMYFAKEYRGKGLGKKLLKHLTEFAKMKNFSKIQLETASVLKEAVGLYQAFGFQMAEEKPHVSRCDISMSLDL